MRDRWREPVVLSGLAVLFFAGVWLVPLQEPDEGRYGDIAASMVRTGDWLTPRLNGLRYYEKPPLYFWLGAASVAVLGPTEAAVRLPSAVACLATVFLLMHWGRRGAGPAAGLLAAAMGGTLPLFALFAHMAMVDLVLTFLTTLALYSAWRGLMTPGDSPSRAWVRVFWCSCALAMLAKGPVGVALPLVSVAGWIMATQSWDRLRALLRFDGLLLFALVAAPWFAAMEALHPGYARDFFVAQNFGRAVAGELFDRNAPPWFYLPILAFCFLPWILFLPGSIRRLKFGRAVRVDPDADHRLFLVASILAPLAILSVAQSKIGYYLLPLAPPIALLSAISAAESWCSETALREDRFRRNRAWKMAAAGLLCLVAGGVIAAASREDPAELNARWGRKNVGPMRVEKGRAFIAQLQREAPLAVAAAIATGAIVIGGAVLLWRRRAVESLLAASCALALMELAAFSIASRLPQLHTARDLASKLKACVGPGEPIVLLEEYMTSLPFYLRRPVTIMDATFPMFGQNVSEEEARGISLQNQPERLAPFLAASPSVLVVCRSAEGEAQARQAGAGTWDTLDRVDRYSILRHRRTAEGSPPSDKGGSSGFR